MSEPARPPVNALVEVSLPDGTTFDSRVEDSVGQRLNLAAPLPPRLAHPLGVGDELTLRWPAGPRGRYVLPATLVATNRTGVPVWVVQPAGATEIEQHRQFVRGGGGEAIRLRRAGAPLGQSVDGHVVDIGEGSVRGRFPRVNLSPGDPVVVQIALGDLVLPASGEVRQVTVEPDAPGVEVVVVYDVGESLAQVIRRYVMRQQLLARLVAAPD